MGNRNLRRRIARKAHRLEMIADTPKVLIGTPVAGDSVLSAYTRSVVHCAMYSVLQGLTVGYQPSEYSMLVHSRQRLVEAAIESGLWTHLLFIDADMQFEPDLALRLVRHRQPIVAANCLARRHPHYLTARAEDGSEVFTKPDSTGIEKVARVGTGIMLVHLELFRSLDYPWFAHPWLEDKHTFTGEDFYFCDKARAAGFDIYIDHEVSKSVNHVGQFAYNAAQRDTFLDAQKKIEAIHSAAQGDSA